MIIYMCLCVYICMYVCKRDNKKFVKIKNNSEDMATIEIFYRIIFIQIHMYNF